MIAKSNDYADWLKISMPDHFVSRSKSFWFYSPDKKSKAFFGLVRK